MIKPEDLTGRAREAYDTWRSLGLTEAAALDAVIEDGHVELSDHDRLARNFATIFGLSAKAAEVAAGGRDGGRPVSSSGSRPVVESEAEWQARMIRELAELRCQSAELEEAQKERLAREITEDIARIQAQERRRIQAEDRRRGR